MIKRNNFFRSGIWLKLQMWYLTHLPILERLITFERLQNLLILK